MTRSRGLGAWLLILGALVSSGCGDDDDDDDGGGGGANNAGNNEGSGGDGACGTLCTGAGFSGGEEADYSGTVLECTCSGSGNGIAQADCADYCEAFDVGADKAFLSTEISDNDKCVCDGT